MKFNTIALFVAIIAIVKYHDTFLLYSEKLYNRVIYSLSYYDPQMEQRYCIARYFRLRNGEWDNIFNANCVNKDTETMAKRNAEIFRDNKYVAGIVSYYEKEDHNEE